MLVLFLLIILAMIGLSVLHVSTGAEMQAVRHKHETAALSAAEAAYEQAVFRMSQQPDMLSALYAGPFEGTLSFPHASATYSVSLATFMNAAPIYEVRARGASGGFQRNLRIHVVQAVNGWVMGKCRVPSAGSSTTPVFFADGEILDIPIEINKLDDSPDESDIYVSGNPQFLAPVYMAENRHAGSGTDKYGSFMDVFHQGIYFNQPESRITDESIVRQKIERFRDSTDARFRFQPVATANIPFRQPAVHLEFFVEDGTGKIRITDNCTVRGFMQGADSQTWDFKVRPGTADQFERYPIYAYHLRAADAETAGDRQVVNLTETYVSQSFGSSTAAPGGQIFVEGNVIIGTVQETAAVQEAIQGRITVVATGNIWIADSLTVSDRDENGQMYSRAASQMPHPDNPNVLGLVAQGVVKIVDPGMSDYSYVDDSPIVPSGFVYEPIGTRDPAGDLHQRRLPDPMIVEASVTVGGGGWGAENVQRNATGGRKETGSTTDRLILRGNLSEAVRGVVGLIGADGYLKQYTMDPRMMTGIVPGNIWLKGKYVPIPAGWQESRMAYQP